MSSKVCANAQISPAVLEKENDLDEDLGECWVNLVQITIYAKGRGPLASPGEFRIIKMRNDSNSSDRSESKLRTVSGGDNIPESVADGIRIHWILNQYY